MTGRLSGRLRLNFEKQAIALECDTDLYDELAREFDLLSSWQDSLSTPNGLLEMWQIRETLEVIEPIFEHYGPSPEVAAWVIDPRPLRERLLQWLYDELQEQGAA